MIAPVMSHAAVEISRLWCERDPNAWMRAVESARARGLTLIEVIADRWRWYRDALARYAYDHRLPLWQVARELRVDWAHGGPVLIHVSGIGRQGKPSKPTTALTREIIGLENGGAAPGGECRS